MSKNNSKKTSQERLELFKGTFGFIINRGKTSLDKWTPQTLFEEKQNDTADVIVVKDGFYELVDIKTRNISKSAQAPNIISAFKVAQLCKIMLDNQEFDRLSINYFEIDWVLEDTKLVCKQAHFAELFKSTPKELYVNWAAAMQIQFHVCDLSQDYKLTPKDWTVSFLKHFVRKVYKRSNYMIKKYAEPFEKYI